MKQACCHTHLVHAAQQLPCCIVSTAVLHLLCVLRCVSQRETNGQKYYEFEFTAKTPRYTRHSLAVVTVSGGEWPAC